jgi:hypothetical protein
LYSFNGDVKSYRVVVVYFKLANDSFEAEGLTDDWPVNHNQPKWKGKLFVSRPYDPIRSRSQIEKYPKSVTAFYWKMSGGKAWIFGDEITYDGPPLENIVRHGDNKLRPQWIRNNTGIMKWLVSEYFEKFEKDPKDYTVVFVNRNRPDFGFQGIAQLPTIGVVNNVGQKVSLKGTYQNSCYTLEAARHIVSHELGHYFFNFGHLNGLHRWSLMSGAGNRPPKASGVTFSAYEREKLGWIHYSSILKSMSNLRLPNLTDSNIAIKIPGPDKNSYFVLENRQYSQPFEPHPKDKHELTETLPGTGLLIYYVDRFGPNIIPADEQVTPTQIGTSPNTRTVYNGDDTDLFGNFGKEEVRLYTNSFRKGSKKKYVDISIKNIHFKGEDVYLDVVYHNENQ